MVQKLIAAFVTLAAVALSGYAQDTLSDEEMFDAGAFDEAVSAGAVTDSQNRLEYLPGIYFVSEAAGYHSVKSGANGSDARFYGKAFLKASKADVGSLYLGYNYSWFLYASAGDDHFETLYRVQRPDPLDIKSSLSEFHVSFDIKKLIFVRIGSQLMSWGATFFWTPVDFVNREREKAAVLSVVDIRTGKPGVRLHIPYKSMNLFLFTDCSGLIKKDKADGTRIGSFSEDIAQAWRIDGTISGVNVGTVGYIGKNRPEQIGFDATGNVLGADVYGEIALKFGDAFRDAPDYAFSIGASRLFGRERNWTGRTEFYFNGSGYFDVDQSQLLPGEFTPFYDGKYYVYGEVTGVNLVNTMLTLSIFGFGNVADRSYSATLQTTLDLPGILPFTAYVRYYGGRDHREFTRAYGGSAWSAGLRIRADF